VLPAPSRGEAASDGLRWQAGRNKRGEAGFSRDAIRSLGQSGPGGRSSPPTLHRLSHNALLRANAAEAIRRVAGR